MASKRRDYLKFGRIRPGFHNDGINIKTYLNNDVVASESGLIIYTGNEIPGYGNLVLIKHNQNWITAYSHLEKINLSRGSNVKKGQKIGTVGISGNVNKPQLHFEIRKVKKHSIQKIFCLKNLLIIYKALLKPY